MGRLFDEEVLWLEFSLERQPVYSDADMLVKTLRIWMLVMSLKGNLSLPRKY